MHKQAAKPENCIQLIETKSVLKTIQTLKEQSDQALHCLLFHMHLLDALPHSYTKLFHFKDKNYIILGVLIFRILQCFRKQELHGMLCLTVRALSQNIAKSEPENC